MFKLAESGGDEHFTLEARKGSLPKLMLQNPTTRKLQDVAGKLIP